MIAKFTADRVDKVKEVFGLKIRVFEQIIETLTAVLYD
jgi:hypothetical protein